MSVELTMMDNGIRVVTHRMPEFETASVGVWINAGGRHEERRENGISHFIEHMAFKGTECRNARDIAMAIESVGGELNAATSKEITAYYARVLGNDVDLALEILGDIVINPRHDRDEFERERNVILQEISASKDCPDDLVYDHVQDIAYPDQPMGRTILGSEASVKRFQPEDLKQYMTSHYSSDRIVIGAAGAVEHDVFVGACEKIFAEMVPLSSQVVESARYGGGTHLQKSNFEQSHLLLAFESPDYHSDDYYDALVLSGLIGGGMSSRLFQQVRERRGLCYSIYSFAMGYSDTGLFGIHTATSGDKLSELMDVIKSEMNDVAGGGLGQSEIDMAKAQLKAGLLMGIENSMSRAEHIVRQVFAFGKVQTTRDLIEKVEAVNLERVEKLCGGLLAGGCPSLAIIGSEIDSKNDGLNLVI